MTMRPFSADMERERERERKGKGNGKVPKQTGVYKKLPVLFYIVCQPADVFAQSGQRFIPLLHFRRSRIALDHKPARLALQ